MLPVLELRLHLYLCWVCLEQTSYLLPELLFYESALCAYRKTACCKIHLFCSESMTEADKFWFAIAVLPQQWLCYVLYDMPEVCLMWCFIWTVLELLGLLYRVLCLSNYMVALFWLQIDHSFSLQYLCCMFWNLYPGHQLV